MRPTRLLLVVSLIGCGMEPAAVDQARQAVAPPGAAATLVSHSLPATLAPGERRALDVRIRNSGTVAWPANEIALLPADAAWRWPLRTVSSPLNAGGEVDFSFVVQAPRTPGPHALTARMYSLVSGQAGPFGPTFTLPTTVDAAATAAFACGFVSSDLPAQLTPGARRIVQVTVQNTGAATWPGDGSFCLYARDDAPSRWGGRFCVPLSTAVAPGATHTFSVPVQSPTSGGAYTFRRQMFDGRPPVAGGVGFFDPATPCVDLATNVAGAASRDAVIVGHTLRSNLVAGERAAATITVRNSGGEDWPGDGSVMLHSVASPVSLFGRHVAPILTPVPTGAEAQVELQIRAPAMPGPYTQAWQMFDASGRYFGAPLVVPTTVTAPAALDAGILRDNLPGMMLIVEPHAGYVDVFNRGTTTWPADGTFGLASLTSPVERWGPSFVPLPAPVPAGGVVRLALPIEAPPAAGTYNHQWRMRGPGGPFGDTLTVAVQVGALGSLTITTAALPSATRGHRYEQTLTASGGGSPTWSARGLPRGLNLSPAGRLGGFPAELGAFTLDVTVSEPGYGSAQASLPLTVSLPGALDAGVVDTGPPDSGVPPDTGVPPDSGVPPDTGVVPDAGVVDSGILPVVPPAPWRWGTVNRPQTVQNGTTLAWDGAQVWQAGHRGAPAPIRWFDPIHSFGGPATEEFCRVEPHLVWTGTKMIMWGGEDCAAGSDRALQSGWVLDPWFTVLVQVSASIGQRQLVKVAMDETTVPGPRAGGHSFWTGSEMLVFGGTCPSAPCYTGGARYDLAQDRWQTMSSTAAPTTGGPTVAVWTGAELVAYGGHSAGSGRWDLATDTWRRIAMPSFPLFPRVAVWSGVEMLVWDGARGGAYRPATDTWRPLPSLDAPLGTTEVRAVWADTEMVVLHNTGGGHYYPATDTWAPTQPAYRVRPTIGRGVVWTGEELFVGDDLSGGGRYRRRHPAQDPSCIGDHPGALSAKVRGPPGVSTTSYYHSISGQWSGGVGPYQTRIMMGGQVMASNTSRYDRSVIPCTHLCVLRVNVTDSQGNFACHDRLYWHDDRPTITVTNPVDSRPVAAGPLPIQASCTDAEGPCEMRFQSGWQGSSLSTTLDLTGYNGETVSLFFEARDSVGQVERIYVDVPVRP